MLGVTPRFPAVAAALFASLSAISALGAADDVAAPHFEAIAASEVPVTVAGDGRTKTSAAMDLGQLIRHAISANKGLAAARIAVTAADEDINIARGRSLPRLDAIGTLEHFPIRDKVRMIANPNAGPDPVQDDTILGFGVQITLPLYTGGRLKKEEDLAQAQREAASSRGDLTQQELIFNVTSTYYTYLLVKEVIAAQEAAVRSLRDSLRIEQARVDVGRAVPADMLRIQTRLSRAESTLAADRNRLDGTLEVLKAYLALPPEFRLAPVGKLAPFKFDVNSPESLRNKALTMRPDLIALRHEAASQRLAIDVAGANLGPTVDLAAQYGASAASSVTQSDGALMLRLRIPLYSGGVLQAQKRKAVARWSELTTRLAGAELQALAEVEKARLELSSTEARIEASSAAIKQAEESLRVEREKFAAARGTSNDLLLAEEALLAARTQYAAAVASSRQALAALQLATGEIGPSPGK